MSDSISRELELRHAALLESLPAVPVPAELRRSEFLERIYERVADDFADELADEVADQLSTPMCAPHEVDAVVDESGTLQHMASETAPGMLDARLRAEIHTLGRSRRRSRAWRRASTLVAAAAVVIVSVSVFTRDDAAADATVGDDRDIVIVRHRVEAPFAPGFSTSGIMRQIAEAGGPRGR